MTNQPLWKLARAAALIALPLAALSLSSCSVLPFVGDETPGILSRDRGTAAYNTAVIKFQVDGNDRPVVIELYPDTAPQHVDNFKEKILSGYYEGMAVHRAIPKFIVQAGDPLTRSDSNRDEWGTGGNSETLAAEISRNHERGSLAMARLTQGNAARRSSDSQFYFTLGRRRELDGAYTVFGKAVKGLDVLDAIAGQYTDTNDAPINRIEISSTALVPDGADIQDPGAARGVGARIDTVPPSQKGPFTRFVERIW